MTGFFASRSRLRVQRLRLRQSSLLGQKRWGIITSPQGLSSSSSGQTGPAEWASFTPSQGETGCGIMNRFASAYCTPRKWKVPPTS